MHIALKSLSLMAYGTSGAGVARCRAGTAAGRGEELWVSPKGPADGPRKDAVREEVSQRRVLPKAQAGEKPAGARGRGRARTLVSEHWSRGLHQAQSDRPAVPLSPPVVPQA